MHWIIGVCSDKGYCACEVDIYRFTGACYDPGGFKAFIVDWVNVILTKERAMRLVDTMYNKSPAIYCNGNPWGSPLIVKQRRKQIDSWRMESY